MSRVNYKRGKLASGVGYSSASGKSSGTTRKNAQFHAAQRAPAPRVKRAAGENGVYDLTPRTLVAADDAIVPAVAAANTGASFTGSPAVCDATPPYCSILNHGISQGQGQSQRDRRSIEMKAVALKFMVRPGDAPVGAERFQWKIWLVYFKDPPSSAVPGGAAICANPFKVAPNDVPSMISQPQLTDSKDYQVIKTWTGYMDSDTAHEQAEYIDAYVNLNGRVTTWNRSDTIGAYTAMETGALGLYFGTGLINGSITAGAGPQVVIGDRHKSPILTYSSRIYFNP